MKHFVIIVSSRDDPEVKELFDAIDKMRVEFESIERPTLEIEFPEEKVIPSDKKLQKSLSGAERSEEKVASPRDKAEKSSVPISQTTSPRPTATKSPKSKPGATEQLADTETELAKLEQEFGESSRDYTSEEIGGWEFDELEQELRSSLSEGNK